MLRFRLAQQVSVGWIMDEGPKSIHGAVCRVELFADHVDFPTQIEANDWDLDDGSLI